MRSNVLLALLASSSVACTSPAGGARSHSAGSGLVLSDMDLSADPGRDFYRFANGGWLDANPVPADKARWGAFDEVYARNELVLKEILEAAAGAPEDELHRKLGDFYASGMDERAIEAQGAAPLAEDLAHIAAMRDLTALPALLAHLHATGSPGLFGIGSIPDPTDASMNILSVAQDGMGLGDKHYYLATDEESVELRRKYEAHVARMLALLGEPEADAATHAATVLALETELARWALSRGVRDPHKWLNKIAVSEAQALTPHFDWTAYLALQGLDPAQPVNLSAPNYFRNVDWWLANRPLDEWKSYLRWHLVHAHAAYLSAAFGEESFDFFGRTLRGLPEQRPRWKCVIDATGEAMDEALGQVFVERTLSPRAKEQCLQMVGDLIAAWKARLEMLEWMGDDTRARALVKLAAVKTKIGYPDKWRDWSDLVVERGSYARNHMCAAEFNFRYDLAKVGKPVDKSQWGMPAYDANAGYNALYNDITFPAGILQPPFFSEDYDDALNYGGIGSVIGHEITHGFDDVGSQYDAQGNLANWWSEADRAEFERRAKAIESQFSAYLAMEDLHLDGKLTLGENMADLAGLTIAYDALVLRRACQDVAPIDGFTPQQRFFLAWARAYRCNYTPAGLKLQVSNSMHAPGNFRAIGPLSNLDAFQVAFGLADDAPVMRPPAERTHVW